MRISDWSSDVCSSDLRAALVPRQRAGGGPGMNETNHSRLRTLADPDRLPALKPDYVHRRPALGLGDLNPPPRILLLYGSLRDRSYSRLGVEEAGLRLQILGCERRSFGPSDLPMGS